jgi:hypothetical protein
MTTNQSATIELVSSNIFKIKLQICSKNTDCTICRQSVYEDSIYAQEGGYFSKIQSLSCSHSFHDDCIKKWYKEYRTCPICAQKSHFIV